MFNKFLCFISVTALVTGCTPKDRWSLKTDYLKIEVNNKGYITSMQNITSHHNREFAIADKPSPILSLYNSQKKEYYTPLEASYNTDSCLFTLTYPNGSIAKVKVQPKDKYFKMKLESLSPRNGVDDIQWGRIYTNITNLFGDIIGVARDTSATVNYAIGMLALDDNTIGGSSDVEGDAGPTQYVVHSPDTTLYPLPSHLHEGQVLPLGGNGISDVAFFAYKEPYYRFVAANTAMVDNKGRIFIQYHSRNRTIPREVYYSLLPNKENNEPNHIDVEAIPGVDFIGSSVALWGGPDDIALMDIIQNIVLEEGLPYPTVDGKWVKDPTAFVPDVICYGNQYDSIISYASQLGFKAISAYDLGFIRPDRNVGGYIDGKDFSKKPFTSVSGNLSHKEYTQKAQEKNILVGRACITNSLAPGTKDASPIPSDSLCYQQKRLLMNEISPTDTIITVNNPKYLDEVASWEGHCENLNMIKIGKELIHYLGVSDTKPYRLLNVTRGYWNTKATNHAVNDTIYKLQVTLNYGYDGVIPNIALQDEIAKVYAEIAAISGIRYYDFDGFEFLWNNGHGYYSTKRFLRKMFDHAKELGIDYIRFTGAGFNEGSWHYQSVNNAGGGKNLYDTETREWGRTTSQGKDARDQNYANYFPISFGSNFEIKDTSRVETYEHIEAMSVGWGVTYALRLSQKDVESCPQKNQIFKAIRTWEDARKADAFPKEIKKMLRNPAYDWRLETGTDKDTWILYQMEKGMKGKSYPLKRNTGN
ncbi:MAG: hypothetical protein PUK02_13700 [Parabacteroides sp.]|nr:hypothetical protein [Parabacteroides sp.]MDD6951963.1 hypothetical protein [Parabacteroides sp.]MDD7562819.1 hypothetical protein [Parabacteroides sp.]MDY5621703.1 hypothetical protein [Bacteroidales bacterium]